MKLSKISRVSIDVLRPSRNINDIIKGTPIFEGKSNFNPTDPTERTNMKRNDDNSQESFLRNPLKKMIDESHSPEPIIVSNAQNKTKNMTMQTPSKYIIPFECLMNTLIVYSVIECLNDISFQAKYNGKQIFGEIVWALFLLDFITNFYFIKRMSQTNLYTKSEIRNHYLKTWALIDLASLIPLRWFDSPNAESFLKLIRITKFERFRNMLRISNISKYFIIKITGSHKRYITLEFIIENAWALFLKINLMTLMSFLMACIWWYWSDLIYRYDYADINFIKFYDFDNETKSEKIVKTMYFVFTSVLTIGYGDFLPTNIYEMGFCILFLMIWVFAFSSLMTTATNLLAILSDSSLSNRVFNKNKKILGKIKALNEGIPVEFEEKLLKFFKFSSKCDRLGTLAKTNKLTQDVKDLIKREDTYFKLLPASLKKDLLNTLFKDYFAYFSVFFPDESDFKYHICTFLQPRRFFPNEIIIDQGQKIEELYFFTKGSVSLNFLNDLGDLVMCKMLTGKYIIGDICVVLNKSSFCCFKAEDLVSGLGLPKRPFKLIIKSYFLDHLAKLKRISLNRSRKLINLLGSCGLDNYEEHLDLMNKENKKNNFSQISIFRNLKTLE